MSARIRTILLVTLVTALIWLWAEGESLSTYPMSRQVTFDTSGNLVIKPNPGWDGSIRFSLQGSNRATRDAAQAIENQIHLRAGMLGVPNEPGDDKVVNFALALGQLPEIRSAGLNVQDVQPASAIVRVIQLVTRELPVRASLPTDVDLLGEATVSPPRVLVDIPKSLDALLPPDAYATAALTKADIGNARDDSAQTYPAAVRLPGPLLGEEGVKVHPDKVNVTFRLKRSVDSYTLPSVPVWFALPPTEGTKWKIELIDQFLRDVTFTGPTDAIARIRSQELAPIAEVRLSSDDLEKMVETKEAVFANLPAGVETGAAVKTVRLKISRRPDESPGGPSNLSVPDPVPTKPGEGN